MRQTHALVSELILIAPPDYERKQTLAIAEGAIAENLSDFRAKNHHTRFFGSNLAFFSTYTRTDVLKKKLILNAPLAC